VTTGRFAGWCAPLVLGVVALAACRPAPVEPPDDGDATPTPVQGDPVERAGKLMEKGDMRGAESVLDEALLQHKDDHELWFAKGVVRQAQGDDDGAMLAWTKALELQTEFVPAIHGIGAILLARGEFDAAIDRFAQALRLQPDFADAHYNIGLALLGAGERPKAIEAFERAVKLAPDDPAMLVQLADMFVIDEKLDGAIALASHAGEVAPKESTPFVVWGNALVKKGDFDGAIARYATALQNDPNNLDARLGLSRAQQRAGKLADAAKQLELLTQVVPDSAVVWAEWGSVLAKQGDLVGALEKFDRAIALDPKFEAAFVRRIGALAAAKRCKEARAAAEALRGLEPADESLEAGLAALGRCKK
jgi:tetratricopeptide (TPR) repeat protein